MDPLYEELPGWSEDITKAKKWLDLPVAARAYVNRVEQLAGVPVSLVSVGPGRSQTIQLKDPAPGKRVHVEPRHEVLH